MAPPKRKKTDTSSTQSLEEMSDSSKPRSNGVKSVSNKAAALSSSGRDKGSKKASKKQSSNKNDPNAKKKSMKRKGDGTSTATTAAASAASFTKKRKNKSEYASARASYTGTEDDSSDEEDRGSLREYPQLPEIGDEIAIKCPPDPPYPEGWYTGVVIDIIIHDEIEANAKKSSKSKKGSSSNKRVENFTLRVEWDGGGEEEMLNPEWRMKGDAPDKHGRVSHRDAKLRPYFKYWVTRLNSMAESEKKLSRTRAGKNCRVDPSQKIEWIQCSNPSCGKWRPLPPYMQSEPILESCNRKWFCVLNSWDEAVASCGAPQETGYMPPRRPNHV